MSYQRVLLKLSGEALKENGDAILSSDALINMATMVKEIVNTGTQVCIVIGAGNIWRGKLAEQAHMDHVQADFMGMLGTVINAVALSSSLKGIGVDSVVTTALSPIEGVTIAYDLKQADVYLNKGKVVFLAGGTGKPFFTTDTAAALRAKELKCDAILMGKNGVAGVYNKDPRQFSDAKFYKTITFDEMIKENIQIMDTSAINLIKDDNIKICVFEMKADNFICSARGEHVGTICHKGE